MRTSRILLPFLLVGAAALAGLLGCAESEPTLRFTAIPDSDRTELEARFRPVADYLSDRLGLAVEYVPTPDYAASVEMFKTGDVQLAWFGGLTGVQARDAVAGARAIAQGAVDPQFRTYFIVHANHGSEPRDLEDLRGLRFTFGSRQSTSGRLMPEYFLREATGQAPTEFFSEVAYSGSHDQTAELVNRGAFDAGAINFRTYESLLESGRIDGETCRIHWATPEYADYNWTAHPGLEERFGAGTTDELQRALLEMEDPGLLGALQRPEGLIAAENEQFAGIESVARELGFLRGSAGGE